MIFVNASLLLYSRWCQQDPKEILSSVLVCIEKTLEQCNDKQISPSNIKALGITNQRESTLVWDKITGEPLHPAISRFNQLVLFKALMVVIFLKYFNSLSLYVFLHFSKQLRTSVGS